MNWTYNGKEFTQGDVGSSFGFVYCIHILVDKKRYIVKKFFTVAGTKQVKGKRKRLENHQIGKRIGVQTILLLMMLKNTEKINSLEKYYIFALIDPIVLT